MKLTIYGAENHRAPFSTHVRTVAVINDDQKTVLTRRKNGNYLLANIYTLSVGRSIHELHRTIRLHDSLMHWY